MYQALTCHDRVPYTNHTGMHVSTQCTHTTNNMASNYNSELLDSAESSAEESNQN